MKRFERAMKPVSLAPVGAGQAVWLLPSSGDFVTPRMTVVSPMGSNKHDTLAVSLINGTTDCHRCICHHDDN